MSSRAVCIGLGYRTNAIRGDELPGTIQNVNNMATVAVNNGFETEAYTDEAQPINREQILDALRSLVASAKPGDHLLFTFAGHGGQDRPGAADEADGRNEFITDSYGNEIYDDEIREILSRLPHGSNMTMAFESCHTGTIADLDLGGIQANVVCISAAMDNQTSLATSDGSLFTNALVQVMQDNRGASWNDIKLEIDSRVHQQINSSPPGFAPVSEAGPQSVTLSSSNPALLNMAPFGASSDPTELESLMLPGGFATGNATDAPEGFPAVPFGHGQDDSDTFVTNNLGSAPLTVNDNGWNSTATDPLGFGLGTGLDSSATIGADSESLGPGAGTGGFSGVGFDNSNGPFPSLTDDDFMM